MDYYPVSIWDDKMGQWVECGRFYRNAVVIDYELVPNVRLDKEDDHDENIFMAPAPKTFFLVKNWKDVPGSSKWVPNAAPIAGILDINVKQPTNIGLDLPKLFFGSFRRSLQKRTIAYTGKFMDETDSDTQGFSWSKSVAPNPLRDEQDSYVPATAKLYEWKAWPKGLTDIFDGYHDAINVKDISR